MRERSCIISRQAVWFEKANGYEKYWLNPKRRRTLAKLQAPTKLHYSGVSDRGTFYWYAGG